MVEDIIREVMEAWKEENRNYYRELLQSAIRQEMEEMDIAEVFHDAMTEVASDFIDTSTMDDIAKEMIFEDF